MSWPHNQTWSESINFPGHNHTLEINADSYNKWVREVCPLIDPKHLADDAFEPGTQKQEFFAAEKNKRLVQVALKGTKLRAGQWIGRFQFGVRTLPYYQYGSVDWFYRTLKRWRLSVYDEESDCYRKGAVMFTGPIHIPILSVGKHTWMSLTPMEVYTLRSAINIAEGRVLVAGLGMGWLTRRILENSDVTSVVQVELDKDILDAFGKPLENDFLDKLKLIHGDIYQFLKMVSLNHFDTIIFDIWSQYRDALDDKRFQEIKDSHDNDNVWGWGDVESSCYDSDEQEYTDQAEDEFENDMVSWLHPEEPQQWWGLD